MAPLSATSSSGAAAAVRAPPPALPFGPTLHYAGCGCPYNWAAGCRLCDWGDSWVQQAHKSLAPAPGQARLSPIRKLKVCFCIPHANITGGLKMLLEQMRLLRERGHHVVAITRSELAASAVPSWSDVKVDEDVVARLDQRFRDAYDVDACDVVVTGIFHQVPEWLTTTSAPVLYYEQGHEWLFGDPVRFCEAGDYAAQDKLFHMVMHLPVALAAVSEAVQTIICKEFGRSCLLVHNGVDCQRFCPGPRNEALLSAPAKVLCGKGSGRTSSSSDGGGGRSGDAAAAAAGQQVVQQQAQQPAQQQQQQQGSPPAEVAARQPRSSGVDLPSVLLVGNPALSLKGFDCATAALALVQRARPIQVHWVCQQEPPEQMAAAIERAGLHISLHISPAQGDLPALYRGHDCFLFTSKYEAWGMPVLEAMASGLPVVAAETAGVCSFATASVDCLMAPAGDAAELAQHVLSVLDDARLAARLAAAGRKTAVNYSPERVASQLERVLYSLTACRQELMALRLQALPDSQMAAAAAVKACSGVAARHMAAAKAKRRAAAVAGADEGEGGEGRASARPSFASARSSASSDRPFQQEAANGAGQGRSSLQQLRREREEEEARSPTGAAPYRRPGPLTAIASTPRLDQLTVSGVESPSSRRRKQLRPSFGEEDDAPVLRRSFQSAPQLPLDEDRRA